ncbi:hypothetical protein ACS0TY_026198 [Phlomoides rotata]
MLVERRGFEPIDEENEHCFKWIWNKFTPLKAIAHSWRVLWDRLPTKLNLQKRNILNPNSSLNCVLCNAREESSRHIFFECEVSYKVWMSCLNWLGVASALQSDPCRNLSAFRQNARRGKGMLVLVVIWQCMIWLIWKARNAIIFEGVTFNSNNLLEELKARVWSWFVVKDLEWASLPFRVWLVNPRMLLA